MNTYRSSHPTDYPRLISLQQYLYSPSPRLLRTVVRTQKLGNCLVSTTQAADAVGYALWLTSTEQTDPRTSDLIEESKYYSDEDDKVYTDNINISNTDATANAHLAELVIHPTYRRQRRGFQLLNAVFTRLNSGTRLTLNVAVNNSPARALYETAGFNPVCRHEGFYQIETNNQTTELDAITYAKMIQQL